MMKNQSWNFTKQEILTVLVVALGYYVDAVDIITFSANSGPSLSDLGISKEQIQPIAIDIISWQLIGLVIGGFLWGILSDKYGRLYTLFGSIIVYSICNILNAYIDSVEQYKILRFVAGIGLGGELGVGISLLTENLAPSKRTIATTTVSVFGMFGAITGGVLPLFFHWETCYLIGGIIGFLLLFLRVSTKESILYKKLEKGVVKGSLTMLFSQKRLFVPFLFCTLAGSSLFVCVTLFIQSAPKFGELFRLTAIPTSAKAVIWFYVGAAPTEIVAGLLSKKLKSRKKPLYLFYAILFLAICTFCLIPPKDSFGFYSRCTFIGMGIGFWTILVTIGAEHFGTNLRATASTSIPNIARAWSIPFTKIFKIIVPSLGLLNSSLIIGLASVIISAFAITQLRETFENDANFIEQ